MGPDEAGNVRGAVSPVVTYSQAVKRESGRTRPCGNVLTGARPYVSVWPLSCHLTRPAFHLVLMVPSPLNG